MKLDEFKQRLEDACDKLSLPGPKISQRGFSFIKVEIKIAFNTRIEIYFNEETQSFTSALILQEKRVFGIDCYPKYRVFHTHPLANVETHVKTDLMQIEGILAEYSKILQQLQITGEQTTKG
jgi:hypothetical protein